MLTSDVVELPAVCREISGNSRDFSQNARYLVSTRHRKEDRQNEISRRKEKDEAFLSDVLHLYGDFNLFDLDGVELGHRFKRDVLSNNEGTRE